MTVILLHFIARLYQLTTRTILRYLMFSDGKGTFFRTYDMAKGGFEGGLNDPLDDPKVSLMRLLDDESFIREFKASTERVKTYMTYSRIKKLVELITVVGDPFDRKRSYLFPFNACDLLCCDNPAIATHFVTETGKVSEQVEVEKMVETQVEVEVEEENETKATQSASSEAESAGEEKAGLSEITAGEEDDDDFGDFVQAAPRKKVWVTQQVKTTVLETQEYPHLIDELLAYFETPINYPLTGYVCKVIVSLINRVPEKILSFLLQSPEQQYQRLFKHMASRSVADLFVHICTLDKNGFDSERKAIFTKLVTSLTESKKSQELENYAYGIKQILVKLNASQQNSNSATTLRSLKEQLGNQELILLVNHLSVVELQNLLHTLTGIHHLITFLPHQTFLQENIQRLLQFLSCQMKGFLSRERLGLVGAKIVEIIATLWRQGSVEKHYEASGEQIAGSILKLIVKFPRNDLLLTQATKILKMSLSYEKIGSILLKNTLTAWLDNQKPTQTQVNTIYKIIEEASKEHSFVQQIFEAENFKKSLFDRSTSLLEKERTHLAGYAPRKLNPKLLTSSKQESLELYAVFLANTPSPVYQVDPNDPFQNPTLLEELQRQLDGTNQPEPSAEAAAEEEHRVELQEENQHHQSAFWKVHLDYDADQLMEHML